MAIGNSLTKLQYLHLAFENPIRISSIKYLTKLTLLKYLCLQNVDFLEDMLMKLLKKLKVIEKIKISYRMEKIRSDVNWTKQTK